MDMGDPEGARSILEEVLTEGNPNQRQEAENLPHWVSLGVYRFVAGQPAAVVEAVDGR